MTNPHHTALEAAAKAFESYFDRNAKYDKYETPEAIITAYLHSFLTSPEVRGELGHSMMEHLPSSPGHNPDDPTGIK